jgi:hypothetical protein
MQTESPHSTSDATSRFLAQNRFSIALVFCGLALVALIATCYFGYMGYRITTPAAPEGEDAVPMLGEGANLDRGPYTVAALTSLVSTLALGLAGGVLLGRVAPSDLQARDREHRVILLVGVGIFGLANLIGGGILFALWFDKLTDWVAGTAGASKQAYKPIVAVLMMLVGAGLKFLALIPARAEERNAPTLRRVVYAGNLFLAALLLLIGLILANVLVGLKLPKSYDVTERGFYTLSESGTNYLSNLKQDVKVYAIMMDSDGARFQKDAQRMLEAIAATNPQRIRTTTLSPVLNRKDIDDLTAKYPKVNLREFGFLIATGANFEQAAYIEFEKLLTTNSEQRRVFNGEAVFIQELMYLTETESVVYFTNSAQEYTVIRPSDPGAVVARPAYKLPAVLEKSRCTCKTLDYDPLNTNYAIPPDADAVVVLDPIATQPEGLVRALRTYLNTKRADGTYGKLIVFAGAHNTTDNTAIVKTGFADLFAEFGIDIIDQALYTRPGRTPANVSLAIPFDDALTRRLPPALAVEDGLLMPNARPVIAIGAGAQSAQLLMTTDGGLVWFEKSLSEPPNKAFDDLVNAQQRGDKDYMRRRQLTQGLVPLALAGKQPDRGLQVAVFGFGDGFADTAPVGADGDNIMHTLLLATINWLRDRPAAPDISTKEYTVYVPNKNVNYLNLFWAPLVAIPLGVLMIGVGVWAVRRK